jgi:hypothetical protein
MKTSSHTLLKEKKMSSNKDVTIVLHNIGSVEFSTAMKSILGIIPWDRNKCDFYQVVDEHGPQVEIITRRVPLPTDNELKRIQLRIANSLFAKQINVEAVIIISEEQND